MTVETRPLSMAETPRSPAPQPYRSGAPNVLVIVFDDLGFAACPIYEPEVQSAALGPDGQPRGKERHRNSFAGKNKGRPKPKPKSE